MNQHPFHAGTYGGKDYFDCSVEDRLNKVKTMTEQQCLAALKLPHLQKTVITALNRRLMKLERAKG